MPTVEGGPKKWEHESDCRLTDLGLYLFILLTINDQWRPHPPVRSRGKAPEGSLGPQKLKQFKDMVDRFGLQKRSEEFENFTQFTSWFLTSMFHVGGGEATHLGAKPPNPCMVPQLLMVSSSATCDYRSWRTHWTSRLKLFGNFVALISSTWFI